MRDYGFLTPVRNQSALGVCWAFSSCASMESNLLKKGRGEYDLSEWQLGYQSRQDVSPDKPRSPSTRTLCFRGTGASE